MRRLIAASIALIALAFGTGTALAVSSGATVADNPAGFSLSKTVTNGITPGTGCEFLPAGVVISWEGTLHSVTVDKLEPTGAFTEENTSVASGKASDEDGNEYAFSYANHFKVTETAPGSGVFTGTMTDHFSLAGNGIKLNNGFTATFTIGENVFSIDPSREYGSPLDFASGLPLCDPL